MTDILTPGLDRTVAGRVRDLDQAAFQARYGCDRFTASVLGSRLRYVIKNVATKLRANAFSPVIRDADDFCVTISGPPELGWPMPAASLTNPAHWGPVGDAVGIILEEVGLETLAPGDIVVSNDSYRTGKHLNDMSFVRPLFWADRLVGAIHITAHQLDVGSRVLGGFDIAAQSIWEDGLVLPPAMLYRAGKPVAATLGLIAANTRFPELILDDVQVVRACLDLGEQLVMESLGRYGIEAYLGAIRCGLDVAAKTMAEAVQVLPDGVYEGREVIDGDGMADSPEYVVAVRIHKRGARLEFDFSGSSAASRSALNCSWLDVKTGVLLALKVLFDPRSTPSSGALANVDIVLPPGSIINPHPPASTMYYFAMVMSVMRAVFDAIDPALKGAAVAAGSDSTAVHHAFGRTLSGENWGDSCVAAGINDSYAWGASHAGDADSASLPFWMNYQLSGMEIAEQAGGAVFLRDEIAADTGGPGYHRGGAGQVYDTYWPHPGLHRQYVAQVKRPAGGANGGGEGAPGATWMLDPQTTGFSARDWPPSEQDDETAGKARPLAGVVDPQTGRPSYAGRHVELQEFTAASGGSTVRRLSNGGGGWGAAHAREPERVLRDVRDGYVSLEGAVRDYAVAIVGDPERDPEGLAIDKDATAALRARRGLAAG